MYKKVIDGNTVEAPEVYTDSEGNVWQGFNKDIQLMEKEGFFLEEELIPEPTEELPLRSFSLNTNNPISDDIDTYKEKKLYKIFLSYTNAINSVNNTVKFAVNLIDIPILLNHSQVDAFPTFEELGYAVCAEKLATTLDIESESLDNQKQKEAILQAHYFLLVDFFDVIEQIKRASTKDEVDLVIFRESDDITEILRIARGFEKFKGILEE